MKRTKWQPGEWRVTKTKAYEGLKKLLWPVGPESIINCPQWNAFKFSAGGLNLEERHSEGKNWYKVERMDGELCGVWEEIEKVWTLEKLKKKRGGQKKKATQKN